MSFNRVEFAVPMTCQSCVDTIDSKLNDVEGIKKVEIDLKNERVIVESNLPVYQLQSLLESSGKRVIVRGTGSSEFASAVAVVGYPVGFTKGLVKGVVRFIETEATCIIEGTIDGLSPGLHGFHIHNSGDLSNGCESIGDHYNPYNAPHGGPDDDISQRHLGDFGNIKAEDNGRASFRIIDKHLKVKDLIGRSISITADRDDLGRGKNGSSRVDGNSGERIACGIIARSAGVMENPKRICLCSGKSFWQEEDFLVDSKKSTDQTTPKLMT